jgi:DNA adenine methylase
MCSYHGGKQRIGLDLAKNIYLSSTDMKIIEGYCEPFCGMLGVYRHIPKFFKKQNLIYKAGDINKSVIEMWKATQNGWIPPLNCTQQEYDILRGNGVSSALKGFIGHQHSFGGQYFKGYNKKYDKSKNASASLKRINQISTDLKMVNFFSGKYTQFSDLENYIIYCDPPYRNATCEYRDERGSSIKFDNNLFWNWVRVMSKKNLVIVSEYSAPEDFIPIFSKKHSSHHKSNFSTGRETLFVYNF